MSLMRALLRELEERGSDIIWYEGLLVAQGKDLNPMCNLFGYDPYTENEGR